MDLSFNQVSKLVEKECIFQDINATLGIESVSSRSRQVTDRVFERVKDLDGEYAQAIRDGDYKKVISICDEMIDALDKADEELKSIEPDGIGDGIRIIAAVLMTIGGCVALSASPIIADSVMRQVMRFLGKTAGGVAGSAMFGGSLIGGIGLTFKGYYDLVKHAIVSPAKNFAGDPNANNVNYRMAADTIRETKEAVIDLRNKSVAYIKSSAGAATESDESLLFESAIECINVICVDDDAAMETLSLKASKATWDFNKKRRDIQKDLRTAVQSADYDGIVKALDELEALVKEFDSRLNDMKADSAFSKMVSAAAKLAMLIFSVIMVITPAKASVPITKILGKIVKTISGGVSVTTGAGIATTSILSLNFTLGAIGGGVIYDAITKAVAARKAKKEHPDDPRYVNGEYTAAKQIVESLKSAINQARIEAMAYKRTPIS